MHDGDPATVTPQLLAELAVSALYERDAASRALGIRILEVRPGFVKATLAVRADMVNGHDICHGGILFMFADSAFAFCCNSFNVVTVAAGATIDFLAPVSKGDQLIATATMAWQSRRTGLCDVVVSNQQGEQVALFRGRSVQRQGQVVPEP